MASIRERDHQARVKPVTPVWPGGPRWPAPFVASGQHRVFERLMHQQFWLWGCDVRRAEGNLLTLQGFAKTRPPAGAHCATSRYRHTVMGTIELTLWGFGLLAQRPGDGALFLPRLSLRPRCASCGAAIDGRWDPHDFEDFRRPADACDHRRVRLLLADLLTWLADYEREVIQEAGLAFRAASIAAWKRPVGPAHEVPDRWDALAAAIGAEIASLPLG